MTYLAQGNRPAAYDKLNYVPKRRPKRRGWRDSQAVVETVFSVKRLRGQK